MGIDFLFEFQLLNKNCKLDQITIVTTGQRVYKYIKSTTKEYLCTNTCVSK